MEFLLLLVVTLVIALIVSGLVVMFFRNPIDKIFARIIGEEISVAWRKFLTFALFVIGVSSGVNIWKLERFVPTSGEDVQPLVLTAETWGLEIYRTIIHTLGGLAWALLVFFVVSLIAFVMIKRGEAKGKA
ncbi:MAG: hypothetical protein KAU36_03750 [candidate division Zixibacteria bacterium]|nr:hypothetical protein [candidate division Zixibacteria bacterium]